MSNLIDKYRATQRRLRRYFDPYTERLCPSCPSPCCRKPSKVREFDVLLANACGCSLPSADESVSAMVQAGIDSLTGTALEKTDLIPCDYIAGDRCAFPDDLRPFECTRWICPYLKREISAGDMREIRALLHRLGVLHRELQEAVAFKRKPRSRR